MTALVPVPKKRFRKGPVRLPEPPAAPKPYVQKVEIFQDPSPRKRGGQSLVRPAIILIDGKPSAATVTLDEWHGGWGGIGSSTSLTIDGVVQTVPTEVYLNGILCYRLAGPS